MATFFSVNTDMMKKDKLFAFYLLLILLVGIEVEASHRRHRHHQRLPFRKLLVFGDSYADTGNIRKLLSKSWKEPYGITFPGKPTGRFSDGRIFTDYLASFMGIRSPIPYRWKNLGAKPLRYGMNFAYGGTGVFDTEVPFPNMTTQIDFLQQLIEQGVYSKWDLQYSMAHVSVAGNDYTTYLARNGSLENVQEFIESITKQLTLDLKRIMDLGVKKIAVMGLEPIGCVPVISMSLSYEKCNDNFNYWASVHNILLRNSVGDLNRNGNGTEEVVMFNLYDAFMSVIQPPPNEGMRKFKNPLKPCCQGINNTYSCGSLDASGAKMYTVCDDPDTYFFWDTVHPTQAAWATISSSLRTTLDSFAS